MDQTIVLACMLLAYIAPVSFVYYKYNTASAATTARSISSIITSQEPFFNNIAPLFQTRYFIAGFMLIMTGFTVMYEYQRCIKHVSSQIWWSLVSIIVLLHIFSFKMPFSAILS
jgi:hypothetical protein